MASVLDPGKALVVHHESASTQEADARAMASFRKKHLKHLFLKSR